MMKLELRCCEEVRREYRGNGHGPAQLQYPLIINPLFPKVALKT